MRKYEKKESSNNYHFKPNFGYSFFIVHYFIVDLLI